MRKMLLTLLLSLPCIYSYGGDYTVEIEPSKKIYYIDKLNLPPNTTVQSLLRTMPELMHRGNILF